MTQLTDTQAIPAVSAARAGGTDATAGAAEVASHARCSVRSPIPWWVCGWFAALMILTLAVRILDPTGWLGSDDGAYYSAAEHILTGEKIVRVHHHYARMAVVVPVAISMRLFGESPTAVALPMFIASTLCVMLVVVLGRLMWGWWEGLCAATVVSLLPYFRVLSTTAYPDVHACLWTTLAMVLAVSAIRMERDRWRMVLGVACGVAIGLATSAKLFSITVVAGVFFIWWVQRDRGKRPRARWLATVALGVSTILVIEGFFYLWAADDFWFRLHALRNIQASNHYFPKTGYHEAGGLGQLFWQRLTMPLHPGLSGWGSIGALFLPAACLVLLFNRCGRPLAVWGLVTYLVVAFMPVSLHNSPQPFPKFYGRHVLTACIPFSLCTAWIVHWVAVCVLRPSWIARGWPVVFAAVVGLLITADDAISGFRHRHTQRVGLAIQQIVPSIDPTDGREIFMTPSMYRRFRILFPPDLKSRLRVAAEEDAPDWWRYYCADIRSRWRPLPPPGDAYLLATPGQLTGQPEHWDYYVGLPKEALKTWQGLPPIASMSRTREKMVKPTEVAGPDAETLLVLLTAHPHKTPSGRAG